MKKAQDFEKELEELSLKESKKIMIVGKLLMMKK